MDQSEAAVAERRAEKLRIKKEKYAAYLIKQKEVIKKSIANLQREVQLEVNVKAIMPTLEKTMAKHGEIELFRKSPIGATVRYTTEAAVAKALKAKKIFVNVSCPVFPSEIKHHAVYFDAPEAMEDLDDDILEQIKNAMGAHGTVVSCRKKGRSVVIFFNDKETRDALIGVEENSEVTVEIGDHAVALHAGLPPNIRKRRKMAKIQAEKDKKMYELDVASGQPRAPKMLKSGK